MAATGYVQHPWVRGTGQTIGAVTADLVTIAVPAGTVAQIEAWVQGRNAALDGVAGRVTASVVNNAGTLSAVASLLNTVVGVGVGAVLGTALVSIVTSGSNVILRVTGVALQTIDWQGDMHLRVN